MNNNTWWDKVSINNIEYIEDPNDKSFPIFCIDWNEIINHKDSKVADIKLNISNMIKKYRKKPVIIEAIQFEDNADCILAIHKFVGQETTRVNYEDKDNPYIKIETLEGTMKASVGDYIIKGVNGEFYPCKPDIFAKTYDEITE